MEGKRGRPHHRFSNDQQPEILFKVGCHFLPHLEHTHGLQKREHAGDFSGFGGREQPTWTQNLLGCISKNTSAHANQKSLSTDAPLSNISIPMKHPSRTGYDWDAAAAAPHPKVNHAHSQRRITRFSLGSRTIETRVHHAP